MFVLTHTADVVRDSDNQTIGVWLFVILIMAVAALIAAMINANK